MRLEYNLNESLQTERIKMKWPSDEYEIPAGTPMSRDGIANDGNAVGILARPARVRFPYPLSIAPLVGKKEPKGNLDYEFELIIGGFVNLEEAQASFGEEYSAEAKTAMSGITFVASENPGLGGGGGATSWKDLAGKPFGDVKVKETVIVPEQEITYGSFMGGSFEGRVDQGITTSAFVGGIEYAVTFDDETYTVIAIEQDGVGALVLDFCVMAVIPDSGVPTVAIDFLDEFSPVTIKVVKRETTITPIPTEYLPEKTIFSFTRGDTTATCNKTFAECVAEYKKGELDVVAMVDYDGSGPSSFLLNITDAVLFEGETEAEAITYGCGGFSASGEFYRINYTSDGSIAVENLGSPTFS